MKTLIVTTSLKIPKQDFKGSNCWIVRFMWHNELFHPQITTQAPKLPTDYLEQLTVYQYNIIHLSQKIITSGKKWVTDEIPAFFSHAHQH
jgi:hypothetical protein